MSAIGVSIYSLRVLRVRHGDAELHNIKDGKGLIDLVKEFIDTNIKSYVDKQEN